jgi:streptogramin lyase
MIPSSHRSRGGNKSEKKPVRLFLEELEGRCLMSHQITPIGGITSAPDGSIWFLEQDRLGRIDPSTGVIQEFAIGNNTTNSYPMNPQAGSIVAAPDGDIWFFNNNHQVIRFDPTTQAITSFSVPGRSFGLAIGPDGNAWVTEMLGGDWDLVGINPATGAVHEFVMAQGAQGINEITIASDGKIWTLTDFIAVGWISVEALDPATGVVQKFSVGIPAAQDLFTDSSGTVTIMQWSPPEVAPTGTRIVDISAVAQVLGQKYESDPQAFPGLHGQWAGFQMLGGYHEDNIGNIWFVADPLIAGEAGPATTGFAEFNPTTGAASFFEAPAIPYFTLGADGKIWSSNFGSWGNYIGRLDPATGAFVSFNEATDAPSASSGNSAPAAGISFNATAGIDFKGAVASFTPQTPITTPGVAYQVTVNWGDGTTSSLVLTVTANGTYNVVADHAYQAAGTFNVTVTIAPYSPTSGPNADPVTVFSTANVSDNPMEFRPFS